jgi:LysR family transcriptional regulator for bpeEF and oprC
MDLNEIYVFSKVVEFKSFTKASEFLGVPKSKISRKVSSLERELGVQLLYRTTRQIELTPAGKKYFSRCGPLIHELDSLNSEISTFSDDISGLIRVTAPEDMALRFFPKIATEFMAMYPRIQLDFHLTGRRVDLIKEPIDLALRVGVLQDSTLKSRKVGELASIIVGTPQFLSMYPDLKNVDDLSKIPAVSFVPSGKANDWVLINNKTETIIKPTSRISTNTVDVLLQLILEHQGIGLIPHFIADEKIKTGELVQIFKNYHSPLMPLHFVTAPQKEIPLKVKRFIEFASEKLALNFK